MKQVIKIDEQFNKASDLPTGGQVLIFMTNYRWQISKAKIIT
jgi:hypothetical protein